MRGNRSWGLSGKLLRCSKLFCTALARQRLVGFQRRVCQPFKILPCRGLLLGMKPHNAACQARNEWRSILLDTLQVVRLDLQDVLLPPPSASVDHDGVFRFHLCF